MEIMKRTHTCGSLTAADDGKTVILNGWVHRNRDHGGIHFINLRDRYGITQIVVGPDAEPELEKIAGSLKFEYCVAIEGLVHKRPDEMINKDMATGEIEIEAKTISILSTCKVLPFMIDEKADARDDIRIKYRFLDLRTESMQKKIRLRHKAAFAVREFFEGEDFYEIETPTLIKSTPEGARDFLVPARLNPGKFFALPQSPQLFKQILMVSGFDKYFQVARCYRDEDARGDRQLEFTQVDVEMSFVSRDDVLAMTERMMTHLFKKTMDVDLITPFPRLSYKEAMDRFGSDKPEQRFAMELQDFAPLVPGCDFKVFKDVLASGGSVKVLVAENCSSYSRKMITELEDVAKTYGAKGLAWMKVTADGVDGGVGKFFTNQADNIKEKLGAKEGDLLLFVADKYETACKALGAVRLRLGQDLKLIDKSIFHFSWVLDFPLFEYNEEEEKWDPAHHMFSMPQERFIDTMEENPGEVIGDLYDLVCNGYELGSGSIRVHDPEIQKRIFKIVGFSEEEAQERFGFLLDSFEYGAPPHGGIATGFDRTIMIMAGEDSIREVIPFPKNTQGASPMEDSPAFVDEQQLIDLHLKTIPVEKKKENK
ncbi:MAG: aspartate--tRNA ligase [Spirochaetales bacterium]|nr:aspartate--tRNA ligase [Spirochaetales bacterium]